VRNLTVCAASLWVTVDQGLKEDNPICGHLDASYPTYLFLGKRKYCDLDTRKAVTAPAEVGIGAEVRFEVGVADNLALTPILHRLILNPYNLVQATS
jgi:hypothetical protein